MSLFAELKRRNVIRVGLFYTVAAWVVVQVAETLLPVFEVSDSAIRVIVLILALGFPLALVFSWVFELTPEGLKLDANAKGDPATRQKTSHKLNLATLVAAVLAIGLVVVDRLMSEPSVEAVDVVAPVGADVSSVEAVGASAQFEREPDPASIAVLPFEDLSPDGDQQYFSDGIAEEILNVLVRTDGLAVASRTSAFRFRDHAELGIPGIAEALDVRHVLEGSVRKAGDTIRVTAQLIDGNTDKHLWSATYDQSLSAGNLFAIQDEIAQAIVDALRNELGLQIDGEIRVASDTENLDAYEIYLRARELFRDRSALPEAFALFERAVELDPGFARAWEGMAAVGVVIEDWGFVDRPYLEMAADAAGRALEIDPGLSMPWAVRAQLESVRRPSDFAEALRLSERALEADPNNATALLWNSILWMNLGFFERALANQGSCLEIDPAYENCRRFKALALQFAGRPDEALEVFLTGVENGFVINRAPSFVRPLLDDKQRAMAMMLMVADDLGSEWQRAMLTFHETGRPAENVREVIAGSPDLSKFDAMHYLLLGAYELAAEIETISESTLVFWDPSLPGLRGSEPFKRMLRKDGVPDYWRTHEYPPQCRPIPGPNGEDDFQCD